MKTDHNNSHLEKIIYSAIEKEKEPIFRSNRVNLIMDKVNEVSLQISFENQQLTPKMAFVYGLSIAASIFLGCVIGNLAQIYTSIQVSSTSLDLINVGFSSLILPI